MTIVWLGPLLPHAVYRAALPTEWTSTMRPLQDKCDPTPYQDVEALFLSDMGKPIPELFEDFDPVPIGVASLAQVHVGTHKESGKKVAVKVYRCLGWLSRSQS